MPTYSIDLRGVYPPHFAAINLRLSKTKYISIRGRNLQQITVLVNDESTTVIALELEGFHRDPAFEYLLQALADVSADGVTWHKRITRVDAH